MLFSSKLFFLSLCVDGTYTKFKFRKAKHSENLSARRHSHRVTSAGRPLGCLHRFCGQRSELMDIMCFPSFLQQQVVSCAALCLVFSTARCVLGLSPDHVTFSSFSATGWRCRESIVIIRGTLKVFPFCCCDNTASSHSWWPHTVDVFSVHREVGQILEMGVVESESDTRVICKIFPDSKPVFCRCVFTRVNSSLLGSCLVQMERCAPACLGPDGLVRLNVVWVSLKWSTGLPWWPSG